MEKISSTVVRVVLPDRDVDGRTQFIDYVTRGGKTIERHGVYLDSEKDQQTIIEMNEHLLEERRDFLIKNAASEESAKDVWLD
jgi:hypothetical protein